MSQLEAKVKLADDLQLELLAGQMKVAELREKLEQSLRRYEELSEELRRVRERQAEEERQSASEAEKKEREEKEQQELDEKLLTSPLVEVEEELVLFKEKFQSLSQENVRLQREIEEARKTHEEVMRQSMMKLLMYMGPVVAVLGYLVLWPYL